MARKLYGGYGLTEMRRYATEYKIAGRSKMDGEQLLAALHAYWDARRIGHEQAVIKAATVGAVLRHKSTGDLVRVTGEVKAYTDPHRKGALYFDGEYVEIVDRNDLMGAWAGRGVERAAYLNEQDRRSREAGHYAHGRFTLWQYEAVEMPAPRLVQHRDIARTVFRVAAEVGGLLCIIPLDETTEGRWVAPEGLTDVAA